MSGMPGGHRPEAVSGVSVQHLVAVPEFGLRLLVDTPSSADRRIRWVTVTELADPSPYLNGDELILTLGSSWTAGDKAGMDRLVERLASVGVAALGFGTGLPHPSVPDGLVSACERWEMPLFEVPITTRFRSIGQYVVDQLISDRYAAVRHSLEVQEALTSTLLAGQGLDGLAARLRSLVGQPVFIVDYIGNVLAGEPRDTPWPIDEIIRRRSAITDETQISDMLVFPLRMRGQEVAFVGVREGEGVRDTIRFSLNLVALELARVQAELNGRRELIGQILQDMMHGALSDDEAARRLLRWGIDCAGGNQVVLAQVGCTPSRLLDVPWRGDLILPEYAGRYLVAIVGELVVVVASAAVPTKLLAQGVRNHLSMLGGSVSVGVGSVHQGVIGLRLSWFEAQEAMLGGPGVREAQPFSLSRLILANLRLPLGNLGAGMLRSLLEYDARNHTNLVETLRAYIEHNARPADTAAALFIHRNTLRYRLQLIERITGRNLDSFTDLVNFHLAILAMSMDPASDGS